MIQKKSDIYSNPFILWLYFAFDRFHELCIKYDEREEDLVAATLRHGLKDDSIVADMIHLRSFLYDPDGLVCWAGFKCEIDIMIQNGHVTLFEVNPHYVKPGEVARFVMILDLYAQQHPDVNVNGVWVVPGARAHVYEDCDACGIRLLT